MTDPKEENPENDKPEDDNKGSKEPKEAAKATSGSTESAAEEDSTPKENEETFNTPMKTETKKEADVEEDDNESKSTAPPVDESSVTTPKTNGSPASTTASASKKSMPPGSRRGRAPAVKGLTIPFRTVKKVRMCGVCEIAVCASILISIFLFSEIGHEAGSGYSHCPKWGCHYGDTRCWTILEAISQG